MGIIKSLIGFSEYDTPLISICSNCGQRFHNYARSYQEAARMQSGLMCPQCEHATPEDRHEYAATGAWMNMPVVKRWAQGGPDYPQGHQRMIEFSPQEKQASEKKSIWQILFGF